MHALGERAAAERRRPADLELEAQGYVDATVLYAAATQQALVEMFDVPLKAVVEEWPALGALDKAMRDSALRFVDESEAWAHGRVDRDAVVEGRQFMADLLAHHAQDHPARRRGMATARDTLLVHVVMIAAMMAGAINLERRTE